MAAAKSEEGLSARLRAIREATFGPRGRAAFARAIDVSPSTYNYYEKGRRPPPDLLARVTEVTGADPGWLLTGRGEAFPAERSGAGDIQLSHPAREALARFASRQPDTPQGAAAAAALRFLLRDLEERAPSAEALWQPRTVTPGPASIPILGRTAAGLPAKWEAWFSGDAGEDILEGLLRQVERRPAHRRPANIAAADPQVEAACPSGRTAALVQLAEPTPDGLVEFIDVPGLGPVEPGTFALRVDGDSMAPRIRDGDVVVSCRNARPRPGHTVIARVRGDIGVTVKLWRPEGEHVHLIPINDACDQRVVPRDHILWACRVLWLVRL